MLSFAGIAGRMAAAQVAAQMGLPPDAADDLLKTTEAMGVLGPVRR